MRTEIVTLKFRSKRNPPEPIFGGLRPPGKQTGIHENCLPLKIQPKKMKVYLYTLKRFFSEKQYDVRNLIGTQSKLVKVLIKSNEQ